MFGIVENTRLSKIEVAGPIPAGGSHQKNPTTHERMFGGRHVPQDANGKFRADMTRFMKERKSPVKFQRGRFLEKSEAANGG